AKILHCAACPPAAYLPPRYQQGGPTELAVHTWQRGLANNKTPLIAEGRTRGSWCWSCLSPAHQSLQITRDLAAFWRGCLSQGVKRYERVLFETPLAG
ncbi:ATP-dependent helicase C-terminal domain-containing protein, partial [Sodalis-like endosymbiont of Proechinophthirus fluctus]|uniref:ATP-dependent helicase C-terminal domain-containing protein n=1 Tax=Sodalis-like endosymbiont of Proechinophthirus fluctus TaxID=1462730 RepID=UPI0016504D50